MDTLAGGTRTNNLFNRGNSSFSLANAAQRELYADTPGLNVTQRLRNFSLLSMDPKEAAANNGQGGALASSLNASTSVNNNVANQSNSSPMNPESVLQ